jgi:hypothetical protein
LAHDEETWIWGSHFNQMEIAFAGDSQHLWCGQAHGRSAAYLLNLESGLVELPLANPGDALINLAVDTKRQWLVGTMHGEKVQGWLFWDTPNPLIPQMHPTKEWCPAIGINPQREQIAWSEGTGIHLLNPLTDEDALDVELGGLVEELKYSADGQAIVAVTGDRCVVVAGNGPGATNCHM